MSAKNFFAVFILYTFLSSVISCSGSSGVEGADWPQWGGPNRNWTSDETGYDPYAFEDGVKVLWETDVGLGNSSVVIKDGWLYTLGTKDDLTSAFCINLRNGKVRWAVPIDERRMLVPSMFLATWSGATAQSTPAVDGDFVYVFTFFGNVQGLKAETGETVWSVNLANQYEMQGVPLTETFPSPILPSPIVVDDLVIVNGNNVLVAFNKFTGDEVWVHKDDVELMESGIYSTPFPVTISDTKYLIRIGHRRLEAYVVENGKQITSQEVSIGMNIPDGFVDGTRILVSFHGFRSEMFRFDGNKFASEWKSRDLIQGIAPLIFADGHLFGFLVHDLTIHGVSGDGLACIDANNGREIWKADIPWGPYSHAAGPANRSAVGGLTYVDGVYFMLVKYGTVISASLSREGYSEYSKAALPGSPDRKYHLPAVVSGGRLYAKSQGGKLVCVDVRKQ